MKKITLLLITLFAAGTMLMAQGGQRRGEREHRGRNVINIKERAEWMSERMAKAYSLNDTQKRQVYEANLIMIADMQPSHRPGKGPRRGHHPGFDKKKGFENHRDTAKIAKRGDAKDKKMERTGQKMERKDRLAEMKQSREAYEAKIKTILTKEQHDAYTKNQAERQKRMEERRADRRQDMKKS